MEPFAKMVKNFKTLKMVLTSSVTLHFDLKSTFLIFVDFNDDLILLAAFLAKSFLKQFAKHRNTGLLIGMS